MRLVRDKETDKFKGKLKFGTADAFIHCIYEFTCNFIYICIIGNPWSMVSLACT